MILPVGASRFEEALQWGSETYHHLKVSQFFKDIWLSGSYGSTSICNFV